MSNYVKRARPDLNRIWQSCGLARRTSQVLTRSRPVRVERANQRIVLSDKEVVSGIIMPFQLGTNWSRFTDATADVLPPMTQ
jgi:hypothetical protein